MMPRDGGRRTCNGLFEKYPMENRTYEQLDAALRAIGAELAGRVEELAAKSAAGALTDSERSEYAEIVRLNDLLSLLKVETEQYRAHRAAP